MTMLDTAANSGGIPSMTSCAEPVALMVTALQNRQAKEAAMFRALGEVLNDPALLAGLLVVYAMFGIAIAVAWLARNALERRRETRSALGRAEYEGFLTFLSRVRWLLENRARNSRNA